MSECLNIFVSYMQPPMFVKTFCEWPFINFIPRVGTVWISSVLDICLLNIYPRDHSGAGFITIFHIQPHSKWHIHTFPRPLNADELFSNGICFDGFSQSITFHFNALEIYTRYIKICSESNISFIHTDTLTQKRNMVLLEYILNSRYSGIYVIVQKKIPLR